MENTIKVLLVEDSLTDAELAEREIKKQFRNYNLIIVEEENGFRKALNEYHPDLILSDYSLPSFDGMTALKIAQKISPEIPFIMFTGSMNEETAVECMKAGAWDYVIKEHIRRLGPAMSRALEEKKMRDEKRKFEEENRLFNEKIQSIFNASTMGIGLLHNRVILEINDAICRMTKYSKEELIGKSARMLYPDEKEYERVGKVIYSGIDQNKPAETETVWLTKDGKFLSVFLSAVYLDFYNKQKGITVTAIDISELKKANEALRESEARYTSLIEASNDLVFIKDENLKYLTINKQTEKFFGKKREEIIGKTAHELMDQKFAENCRKSDLKVLISGTTVVNEEIVGQRVFEVTKFPVQLANQKTVIGAIIRDITEKYRNNLLMSVQYIIADAVIKATYTQELYETIKKVLGKLFNTSNFYLALYNPQTKMLFTPFLKDEYDNIMEWPAEKSLTGYLIRENTPLLLKKKEIDDLADRGLIEHIGSRSECWMGVPIRDEKNAIGAMVVQNYHEPNAYTKNDLEVFEIIANQFSVHLIHKKLQEESQKLSLAVRQSPLSVVITDTKGNIEYVNPKFCEITGYSSEEALGQNPRIIKSGYHDELYYKGLWDTITQGNVWKGEFYNKKKNGEFFWESASITPVFSNDGEITHFLAIKEDITEKKKIINDLIEAKEKAEESNRLKSSFLNNISHEIRTPLNGIIGFIELLTAPDITPEEFHEYIEVIKDCGYQLIDVVTQTINYSMIESGQEKFVGRPFNVNRMINNLVRQFREKNKNENVNFEIILEIDDNDSEVLTDEPKLRQILTNLLSNAFKFTEKGEVRLICRKTDNRLYFDVADTGIGISPEYHDFIFQKFTKIESDKTTLYRGTGLGLAICKAYIEMLGGNISLESESGKGSVFHVTVPCSLQKI